MPRGKNSPPPRRWRGAGNRKPKNRRAGPKSSARLIAIVRPERPSSIRYPKSGLQKVPSKPLHFSSPRHLSSLFAGREENLVHAERALGVKLTTREDWLKIDAPAEPLTQA